MIHRLPPRLARACGVILFFACFQAHAGSADISGTSRYTISSGVSTLEVERITNNTTNRTTGTLYLTLRATAGSDPFGSGYTLQQSSLQYINGTGQLAPGGSFVGVRVSDSFSAPPSGTYYVHLYTSEFPNLATALDVVTFPGTEDFGTPGPNPNPNPGPGPGPGDSGNNTRAGATSIALNSSANGAINPAGDIDYWVFTLPAAGQVRISTTGPTDTLGALESANGSPIAENDDGPGDLNFVIEQSLAAGTYYVRVEGFGGVTTGNYTLSVQYQPTSGGNAIELLGNVRFSVSAEGRTRFQVDRICNRRSGGRSGTLYLALRYSTAGPAATGFTAAERQIERLDGGTCLNNIDVSAPFAAPPDGTYNRFVVLTEFDSSAPSQRVLQDSVALGTEQFESAGSGGGGGALGAAVLLALFGIVLARRRTRASQPR